jgi:hypothetical protein
MKSTHLMLIGIIFILIETYAIMEVRTVKRDLKNLSDKIETSQQEQAKQLDAFTKSARQTQDALDNTVGPVVDFLRLNREPIQQTFEAFKKWASTANPKTDSGTNDAPQKIGK